MSDPGKLAHDLKETRDTMVMMLSKIDNETYEYQESINQFVVKKLLWLKSVFLNKQPPLYSNGTTEILEAVDRCTEVFSDASFDLNEINKTEIADLLNIFRGLLHK